MGCSWLVGHLCDLQSNVLKGLKDSLDLHKALELDFSTCHAKASQLLGDVEANRVGACFRFFHSATETNIASMRDDDAAVSPALVLHRNPAVVL